MDLNRVTLIGHLAQDPEVKQVRGGGSLASFTLATNRVWRDAKTKERKEAVEFHPITAWGRLGEVVSQYGRKGNRLYVEGRLAHKTFPGAAGGKQKIVDIVAENLILLSPRVPDAEE